MNEMPSLWNAPEYRKEPYRTFTTAADTEGRYTIPELPKGTAHVSVAYHINGSRLDTFRSVPRKVRIKPGAPVELAVYLTPADWFDL